MRDEDRVARNMSRKTKINQHCLDLDKYIIMNATYTKISVDDKSICNVISYLSTQLHIKLDTNKIHSS